MSAQMSTNTISDICPLICECIPWELAPMSSRNQSCFLISFLRVLMSDIFKCSSSYLKSLLKFRKTISTNSASSIGTRSLSLLCNISIHAMSSACLTYLQNHFSALPSNNDGACFVYTVHKLIYRYAIR